MAMVGDTLRAENSEINPTVKAMPALGPSYIALGSADWVAAAADGAICKEARAGQKLRSPAIQITHLWNSTRGTVHMEIFVLHQVLVRIMSQPEGVCMRADPG